MRKADRINKQHELEKALEAALVVATEKFSNKEVYPRQLPGDLAFLVKNELKRIGYTIKARPGCGKK